MILMILSSECCLGRVGWVSNISVVISHNDDVRKNILEFSIKFIGRKGGRDFKGFGDVL